MPLEKALLLLTWIRRMITVSRLLGLVFRRFHQPQVTGEILARDSLGTLAARMACTRSGDNPFSSGCPSLSQSSERIRSALFYVFGGIGVRSYPPARAWTCRRRRLSRQRYRPPFSGCAFGLIPL